MKPPNSPAKTHAFSHVFSAGPPASERCAGTGGTRAPAAASLRPAPGRAPHPYKVRGTRRSAHLASSPRARRAEARGCNRFPQFLSFFFFYPLEDCFHNGKKQAPVKVNNHKRVTVAKSNYSTGAREFTPPPKKLELRPHRVGPRPPQSRPWEPALTLSGRCTTRSLRPASPALRPPSPSLRRAFAHELGHTASETCGHLILPTFLHSCYFSM